MFEDETPVAWNALQQDAIVVAADGTEIGRVQRVLGDEQEDIFHAIVMRRPGDGRAVEVPSRRIQRMTEQHVATDLSADDVSRLAEYRAR